MLGLSSSQFDPIADISRTLNDLFPHTRPAPFQSMFEQLQCLVLSLRKANETTTRKRR
jgi:hypothetical protein